MESPPPGIQPKLKNEDGLSNEQGDWVGLFTSYAPLNNPRLAVVVIARVTDGRNHFPAAVAGRIYRDLNARFGGLTMEQIATAARAPKQTEDSATNASLSATEKDSLASDDDESDQADDDSAVNAAPRKPAPTTTIWGDPRRPAESKVRRVLMPVTNQTGQTARPATAAPQTEIKPSQRPRRATTNP